MGNNLRGLLMLVVTSVLVVGCATDISGEKQVFQSKTEEYYSLFQRILDGFQVDYAWHEEYVDITARSAEGVIQECTFKLNESRTAWLKISGSEYCADSVSVP